MSRRVRSVRHGRILDLFDVTRGAGLEIGPLFDPVVDRADGDIHYVDVHPAAELRQYYAEHPGVPLDDIVDPDFVLIGPDGLRTLPEAIGGAGPFDWVIASHVIEHVPDLIGWLSEVGAVLADGGRLVLAIPDRRYSFDAERPATTVGEMLLAHDRHDGAPSVRAVYDHYSRVVTVDPAAAWAGHRPTVADRIHGLDYVREQLRLAREEGTYVDCHVWLFTPQSFVDQLAELAAMDLMDFVVDEVIGTAPNELEFYAVLRRLSRDLEPVRRSAEHALGFTRSGLDDSRSRVDGEPEQAQPAQPPTEPAAGRLELLSPREARLIEIKRSTLASARKVARRCRSLLPG